MAPGPVTAVDTDPAVLAAARDHAHERGVTNVTFVCGDLRRLGIGPHDVVHAHQVLQHLADPVQVLGRLADHAGSGGLVAVRDADYAAFASTDDLTEIAEGFHAWARAPGASFMVPHGELLARVPA